MSKNRNVYIADMLRAIAEIEQAQGLPANLWIRVVERNLEILGEAARRLGREVHAHYPAIPWAEIVATRNIIAHGYDGVDPQVLRAIVEGDLPGLKEQLLTVKEL